MKKRPPPAPEGRFHQPFASLASLLPAGGAPPDERTDAPAEAPGPDLPMRLAELGKLVVREEKKGRKGKTVTVVDGLLAGAAAELARPLARALGCGATVEDDNLVLQGQHADRVAAWLGERGARRVIVGARASKPGKG